MREGRPGDRHGKSPSWDPRTPLWPPDSAHRDLPFLGGIFLFYEVAVAFAFLKSFPCPKGKEVSKVSSSTVLQVCEIPVWGGRTAPASGRLPQGGQGPEGDWTYKTLRRGRPRHHRAIRISPEQTKTFIEYKTERARGDPEGVRGRCSGPAGGALEEVVTHDGDERQEHRILLEIHLLVPVVVQVAHELLQALLLHLLLRARERGVTPGCWAPRTHPQGSAPSSQGAAW